jgi:hypothetical protein
MSEPDAWRIAFCPRPAHTACCGTIAPDQPHLLSSRLVLSDVLPPALLLAGPHGQSKARGQKSLTERC